MKISWIFWWIVNVFWLVIFTVGAVFLWLREVDGAGATQTTELKLVSIFVLLILFVIPAIIQIIWMVVNLVVGNKNKRARTIE